MDELNEVDDSLAFTTEDELELLRGSALAIALATIKFLRERGIAIDDWARSLSASFAKGWDTSEPWSPEEFLDAVLLNIEAFGGLTEVAEYDDDSARARVSGFPDVNRVDGMDLEDEQGDVLFDLFRDVARQCSLDWSWERTGEDLWVTVSRPAQAG